MTEKEEKLAQRMNSIDRWMRSQGIGSADTSKIDAKLSALRGKAKRKSRIQSTFRIYLGKRKVAETVHARTARAVLEICSISKVGNQEVAVKYRRNCLTVDDLRRLEVLDRF